MNTKNQPDLWLYRGKVTHQRWLPHTHAFSYPALFICFPLTRMHALKKRLFGVNRFNLFSLHDADYGDGAGAENWGRRVLAQENMVCDEIYLMTMPRILGFAFNPVSFWFCHDSHGLLRAIITEVNNTFGERHCYLLRAENNAVITVSAPTHAPLTAQKIFHVSPFFPVLGHYQFRFIHRNTLRSARIDYWQDDQLMLQTSLSGQARPFTSPHLLALFGQLGWATLMVVIRIHWQAFLLWRKGCSFHRKPAPPTQEIS